ncbi:MAG: hypothetical protein DRQ48_01020 [Gammaproteobacteria bacterium]|nr:MAG: hypothetical protein DRQ44_00350 [Gammaproteobacteria bacterium]RKZ72261.1 MAG: hypothetical protein DRQ48_01020 [Gammaproteobacteria bacterium]
MQKEKIKFIDSVRPQLIAAYNKMKADIDSVPGELFLLLPDSVYEYMAQNGVPVEIQHCLHVLSRIIKDGGVHILCAPVKKAILLREF